MAMLIKIQLINWHQGHTRVREWQIGNGNKGTRLCKHHNKKSSVSTSMRGDVNARITDGGITTSALCCLPSVSGTRKVPSAILQPPVDY